MPTTAEGRFLYGPGKYAAFHLLMSRWLRTCASATAEYVYVTLGGTELRDIQSVNFIDPRLGKRIFSFETDRVRHRLALETIAKLSAQGIEVSITHGSFFDYKREAEEPHIFFLDLPGICAWGDYDNLLGKMFQNEVIKEGDVLLVTSSLGHHRGIPAIRKLFSGIFSILKVTSDEEVSKLYRRAHPAFTIFNALNDRGLLAELKVRCFGCVKYRDGSPMGLYGYEISAGQTDLKLLAQDKDTRYFDMARATLCAMEDF